LSYNATPTLSQTLTVAYLIFHDIQANYLYGFYVKIYGWIFQVESDVYVSHDSSVLSAEPSMLYDTNQTKEDLVKEIRKQQLLVLDNNETRL
jgi:hypothetical protein